MKSGQTIFEMLAFMALFALVFFPAHWVANRAGLFPGFFLGFVICMAIAYTWARAGRKETEKKKRARGVARADQHKTPPNQASHATSEPAPGADSSAREG